MAQGTRLSAEQIQLVADALGTSPAWRAAADHAGIHEDTIHLYRRRAEQYANRHIEDQNFQDESDPDHYSFVAVQAWVAARSRLEMSLVHGVLDHIPKDWKAAHAMLKSGWPKDYSERVELTGAGGGPVQISTDELRAQIEADLARVAQKREAAGGDIPG